MAKITAHAGQSSKTYAYSKTFRGIEIASILLFIAASIQLGFKYHEYAANRPDLAFGAFLVGWVLADFVSGFVHWAGDTWGTPDWFLIGQTLILTFRQHHMDQKAITRHDYIETNGSNCMISLPTLAFCLWASPHFLALSLFSMVLWVFATNQIHKWAHQDERPAIISLLQRWGAILSPEHHSIHHIAPFSNYYCITTGWLNRPLNAISFFRHCETVVTFFTGGMPRDYEPNEARYLTRGGAAALPQPSIETD